MWTADFFSGCLLLASDPRRSVRGLYSSTGFQAAHPALLALQGPALVAYNDAKFTPRDFEALTKVGGATKRADSSKTGNYGQGFNAVYHLTDVQEAGQFRNPEPLGNLCFTEHEARTEGGGAWIAVMPTMQGLGSVAPRRVLSAMSRGPSSGPPQIRSGPTIVMLDPNRAFLAPRRDPGKKFDVTHHRFPKALERYADSFEMLNLWGAGLCVEFEGALQIS